MEGVEQNQVECFIQNPATESMVMKNYNNLSECGWRQYMIKLLTGLYGCVVDDVFTYR